MTVIFKNARVYRDGGFVKEDFSLSLSDAGDGMGALSRFQNVSVFPAFCDVHVHFREPGFFYKETIRTGCLAAAHGGYSDVCTMPNLSPVPDSVSALSEQQKIIDRTACIHVHPYAAITVGQQGRALSDMQGLAAHCVAFSDDGRGVQDGALMRQAMQTAKRLGKMIVAHCEDQSLLSGGYIHDGAYAKQHGHPGICAESEYRQLERDLALVAETGCKYHACHLSCAESVALIRQAKKAGLDVSCETAPHYLVLSEADLKEDGCFKMNPPLRTERDRQALLEGVADGTIDMIATDHAPHSAAEKSGGLRDSLMGIVGLETAFPILYTELVLKGLIPLERLVELMATAPRRRFEIPDRDDRCIFAMEPFIIHPDEFLSKGKSTPFAGRKVYGRNLATICDGKAVWQYESTEK